MAMQGFIGDRRHFLVAGLASVAAVGAAPALASFTNADPIAAYNTTVAAFNEGDLVSDAVYDQALQQMEAFEPTCERDFVRKFIAMWGDGGSPTQERVDAMLACGLRLVGEF